MNSDGNGEPTAVTAPIYMVTVSAPTNIACIKYWGKDSVELNTPINDSVSVTLDQEDLRAVTTAAASTSFTSDRLWLNGVEDTKASTSKRFRACVDQILALATDKVDPDSGDVLVSKDQWRSMRVHVSSYNTFPTAAGLASSAAGYAALVFALMELVQAKESYPGEFTAIARQGSGSACRSMYGGFVAWRKGSSGRDSIAEQIATEHHWPDIRAIILVVSDAKKDTSSTQGMTTSVNTSQLLAHRASCVVPERMERITKAYLNKDFETFGQLTMADSNQFHATCLDTYPPIFYMNDTSRSVIKIVHAYNEWAREIRAAYTFDAGPNAVIYCLESNFVEIVSLILHYFPSTGEGYIANQSEMVKAAVQKHSLSLDLIKAVDNVLGQVPRRGDVKMIYFTKSGPGPLRLGEKEALIDPHSGLNVYYPTCKKAPIS
jgi:diphosphomevalonate decarboxylase